MNSIRATQFRQWATGVLKEFAIKGYVLDEIRLSERRFYQKLTDIYATSVDYHEDASTTKTFFARVQNKLHYAIHGNTAAELIYNRADSNKNNMGLNSCEKSS